MTIKAYQSVKRTTLVEGKSAHQLTAMLYDGALSNLAIARQHLASNDFKGLHASIDKCIAIVQELQGSLQDYETNELSGNLFELYNYIVNTLIDSNKDKDDAGLVTCENLLDILRDAWQSITSEPMAA